MADEFSRYKSYRLPEDGPAEVHILTSEYDADLATFALLSWIWIGKMRLPLCIHDDGSLNEVQKLRFFKLFPGSRIVSRTEADCVANSRLVGYPILSKFRQSNNTAMKLLDFFFFARSKRIVLLDSDVMTFDDLHLLRENIMASENIFLPDYQYAFNLERAVFDTFGASSCYQPLNSGLAVVHDATLDLATAEKVIEAGAHDRRWFWTEQSVYAILSAPFGVRLLPRSFNVCTSEGIEGYLVKHYVWKMRALARQEALPVIDDMLISLMGSFRQGDQPAS